MKSKLADLVKQYQTDAEGLETQLKDELNSMAEEFLENDVKQKSLN